MTAVQWRRIAERLADRLSVHAFCESHPASAPDPDCPFCGDRTAYQAYLNAGGQDCRRRPPAGKPVPIAEWMMRTREEQQ